VKPPLVALAEPEPALRAELAAELEARGCSVIELRDGVELLEFLGEVSEFDEDYPQLLVCEDIMPGLGALDVLAELRDAGSHGPPAVLLADAPDRVLRDEAHRLGVALVLDKPLDAATMGWWIERLAAVLPG
jgi:CheY-like chemotaxis protein